MNFAKLLTPQAVKVLSSTTSKKRLLTELAELAETAHRGLRTSKKEADKAHHFYIVSLRCLHSIQDMLRAMRGAGAGHKQSARVEVQDLMSKLMSGETLSTEELMQLQRFD